MKQTDREQTIAMIERQNREIGFSSFGYDDAYEVGRDLMDGAKARSESIAVSIVFGEQRVFHAARSGTSANNDDWLARKTRVAAHFDAPSLLFALQFGHQPGLFQQIMGLDVVLYAPAGGAFPLRVNGSLIGVAAVSGLSDREDHDRVVDALRSRLEAAG